MAILPFRVRNQNNIIRDPLPGDSPPKYEELGKLALSMLVTKTSIYSITNMS